MPHPSTSPHINPIENGGSSRHYTGESANEAEIEAAMLEEWAAIPQDWINELILKQEHWVYILMDCHE
jgi:hypothetical protein